MNNKHKNLMKKQDISSLIAFNNMILDGSLSSKSEINKWFDKLVDKKDLTRGLRDSVLEHCYSIVK